MKSLMLCSRITALAVASVLVVAGALILAGCDLAGSNAERITCESRTGNSMTARVDGEALCTDIGTALLLNVDGSELSVGGFFVDTPTSGASITINVDNPEVATLTLSEGFYSTEDESVFYVVDAAAGEGTGTVTLSELSDTRVTGTFAFTAIGIDVNSLNPNGEQVEVTDGTFDVALASEM